MRISLVIAGGRVTPCHRWRGPVIRHLDTGTSFRFRGSGIEVGYLSGDTLIATVTYTTSNHLTAWAITDVGGPLTLRFNRVVSGTPSPMVCT
jgi:hypothetical protein